MNLLITGGDARLGRAVCAALGAEAAIRAIDDRFTHSLPHEIETREGDLRDPDFVTSALSGIDVVLHLAPLRPPGSDDFADLDRATRGTYVLATRAIEAGVKRFIVGSTLNLFDRLPAQWRVNESWRPRPEPSIEHLCPWLAELSARECLRDTSIHAFCLRFGRPVDDAEAGSLPYDPRWLHLDDAIAGVRCALAFEPDERHAPWAFHITAAGDRTKIRLRYAGWSHFGYQPTHDFHKRWDTQAGAPGPDPLASTEMLAPPQPIQSRTIRNVVIFGAGGPVGAALAQEIAPSYTLHLTDARPISQIAAEGKPQSTGAPLPVPLGAPHTDAVVDVRDPAAVEAACEGMDAIVNCSVLRHDPVDAFLVNTLGAYNIMRAAVAKDIRRVVQTGPAVVLSDGPVGYGWDYDISADARPRPSRDLYIHSKYLGQEICRVFADYYDLEVPVLLFCIFINPATHEGGVHPFTITWQDSARALRRALEVSTLPSPYEVMNIGVELPHGKYNHRKACALLGWEPADRLERFW